MTAIRPIDTCGDPLDTSTRSCGTEAGHKLVHIIRATPKATIAPLAPLAAARQTAAAKSADSSRPTPAQLAARGADAAPEVSPLLTRPQLNPRFMHMPGRFLVDLSASGLSTQLSAPAAVALADAVTRRLPAGTLTEQSVTEIVVAADRRSALTGAASPSGTVQRRRSQDVMVDEDHGFRRIYLSASALDAQLGLRAGADLSALSQTGGDEVEVARLQTRSLAPLIKRGAGTFVGGLISISAEPPEAFFAASTQAELQQQGWPAKPAEQADVWVYRVPDSRPESYFAFGYPTVDRPRDTPHQGKLKIATGIGPAHSPQSSGGAEADVLWMGDEQAGALNAYLHTLSQRDLSIEKLYAHEGFVQKLPGERVVIGNIARQHTLTRQGFDGLTTDPAIYRRIISREYDQFLGSLFAEGGAATPLTYLLATSRGCSQGCTICCSAGLGSFQFFSADRVMQELEKIAAHAGPTPGAAIDVFFVDSNFNNNPARLIELGRRYAESPLNGRFRFHVRHNTVNGFLKPTESGEKTPHLDLIRAYAQLGITEVFMGVDTYDDASTRTLKTNKFRLAKQGNDTRPTYTAAEVRALIAAFEAEGLASKGFLLVNNPWVSDLDRLDGYFNLLELWLGNPHFCVDARDEAIGLKPFAGSPIAEVAATLRDQPVVEQGVFVARSALGEIDGMMRFSALCKRRAEAGPETALTDFAAGLRAVRARAAAIARNPETPPQARQAAELLIRKLVARERAFLPRLEREAGAGVLAARELLAEARVFAAEWAPLPQLTQAEQDAASAAAAASLVHGLGQLPGAPVRAAK